MLISLHVKNLALIEEQEIEFGKGLNILTGETGAGKSILIGSINLALGAKADASMIRTGAEYALIEMVFKVTDPSVIRAVKELGMEPEDGELILQRKISDSRSSCKCNGENVSARQLRELAGLLLALHGQNDHQDLLHTSKQLRILDDYAGDEATALKKECEGHYRRYTSLQEELDGLSLDERMRERELELARFELEEIDGAAILDNEDESLEKDYKRFTNAQRISTAVGSVREIFRGPGNVSDQVGRALREVNQVTAYDEELYGIAGQLEDIESLLGDLERGISEYGDSLEFDGEAMERTQERLDLINRLKSKFGGSIESIREYRDRRERDIDKLENIEETKRKLSEDCRREEELLRDSCEKLSALRRKEADRLAGKMRDALKELNFLDVRFEIRVDPDPGRMGAGGFDSVCFMISTNPGEDIRPLDHVASGGELSRIMLAFQTVIAGKDMIDTFVFDEIDTGISGQTAWKVSGKLKELAGVRQLICITHLPQIAAMADTHFLIQKGISGERTVSRIERLSDDEADRELARMLGGEEITDVTLANAREMRAQARQTAH